MLIIIVRHAFLYFVQVCSIHMLEPHNFIAFNHVNRSKCMNFTEKPFCEHATKKTLLFAVDAHCDAGNMHWKLPVHG